MATCMDNEEVVHWDFCLKDLIGSGVYIINMNPYKQTMIMLYLQYKQIIDYDGVNFDQWTNEEIETLSRDLLDPNSDIYLLVLRKKSTHEFKIMMEYFGLHGGKNLLVFQNSVCQHRLNLSKLSNSIVSTIKRDVCAS